jgi:hypothetical protein
MAVYLILMSAFFTSDPSGLSFTRVRASESLMIALVREGYGRSPSFRDLVDTLQRSNVIVIVQPGICAGGRIRSCVVAVAGTLRERQIRIKVDTRTSGNQLIATIGHELQHAVEIAENTEITDGPNALKLYRRLGIGRCRDGLSEECETERALTTEKRILVELSKAGH